MKDETINYAAPAIDDLELGLLGLLCQSQLEDIVGDDSDGLVF
jgi:hypothetical protein